jgi:glutathione peroxidase-family protein
MAMRDFYGIPVARIDGGADLLAWNFEKFLIGRGGQVLRRYSSGTHPEDKGLSQDIADAL